MQETGRIGAAALWGHAHRDRRDADDTPRARKGLWLLALLALRRDQEVARDWLAAMLWPDSTDPLATLRRTLTDLRRVMGEAAPRLTSPKAHTLRLSGCQVDVLDFDDAARRTDPESLERAIALYRGPLLETCEVAWIVQERAIRTETFLRTIEAAASLHRENGRDQQAIAHLRKGIVADPYRESLYRMLMETLADAGETAEAILFYRNLRLWMRQEMRCDCL